MAEAIARIPDPPGLRRRWLEAELHLNLFTKAGYETALPTYTELLDSSELTPEERTLASEQLAAVRAALE